MLSSFAHSLVDLDQRLRDYDASIRRNLTPTSHANPTAEGNLGWNMIPPLTQQPASLHDSLPLQGKDADSLATGKRVDSGLPFAASSDGLYQRPNLIHCGIFATGQAAPRHITHS